MKTSKIEEMHNWLEANPGKTKRDWLIEVRCTTNEQRDALNEILDQCDEHGISYEIGLEINVPNEYAKYYEVNKDKISESYKYYAYDECKIPKDFESLNSQRLTDGDEKVFVESKDIDLYFPSLGWIINIGEEIDEAVTECHRKTWSEGKGSDIVGIGPVWRLLGEFLVYLKDKYKQPLEEQRNSYDKPQLIPWNNTIAKSESIKKYRSLPFDIGYVSGFIRRLFKENYREVERQIVSNRREKFLSANPDIKERRENMLHTLVIGKQKESDPITTSEIITLLNTVDNELSVLYPEYGKLSIL